MHAERNFKAAVINVISTHEFSSIARERKPLFQKELRRLQEANAAEMVRREEAHEGRTAVEAKAATTSRGIMGAEEPISVPRDLKREALELKVMANLKDALTPDPDSGYYLTEADFGQWMLKQNPNEDRTKFIRCQYCGTCHFNPPLLDTYRTCPRCSMVLAQPKDLRNKKKAEEAAEEALRHAPQAGHLTHFNAQSHLRGHRHIHTHGTGKDHAYGHGPGPGQKGGQVEAVKKLSALSIMAASYGRTVDPAGAVDVTAILSDRVVGGGCALRIDTATDLRQLFQCDPAPGEPKLLRIRYQSIPGEVHAAARRFHAEIAAHEGTDGHLAKAVDINIRGTAPILLVHSARFGHPLGLKRGRGSFDVTELVQARVDEIGGTFLHIGVDENMEQLFGGQPCPGKHNELVLEYEICGVRGKEVEYEINGHLLEDLYLDAKPILAPMLLVTSATYGITQEGIDTKIKHARRVLYQIKAIRKRQQSGELIQRDEYMKLRSAGELEAQLKELEATPVGFVDVTRLIQDRITTLGHGAMLTLLGRKADTDIRRGRKIHGEDDLNVLFGSNPCPGYPKELRIDYQCPGHDAECRTDTNEITASGHQRNTIGKKRGQVVLKVDDDPAGKAVLREDFELDMPNVMPVVEITRATYGHPANLSKTFDVTSEVRIRAQQSRGKAVHISAHEDLYALFRDPCPGVRKKLQVDYIVRGYMGSVRVKCSPEGTLAACIDLGYPPKVVPEELRAKRELALQRRATLAKAAAAVYRKSNALTGGPPKGGGGASEPARKLLPISLPSGTKPPVKKPARSAAAATSLPAILEH